MGPFDVVIAGAGPVGLTVAGALAGSGLSVLLLNPHAAAPAAERPIALSHGSRLLLEQLGAWNEAAATPIATIHVSQHRGWGRTIFQAGDYDLPALGYVVPYSELVRSLATRTSGVLASLAVSEVSRGRQSLTLKLANPAGSPDRRADIETKLLVLADGNSGGHKNKRVHDYRQSAIVTTAKSSIVRKGYAWERFAPQGPLALLPYSMNGTPQGRHYAVIWSVASALASGLLTLDDAPFSHVLTQAFGSRLGDLRVTSGRHAFPLVLRSGDVTGQDRTVVIGNASQTLHPVAGQGLNLGLRDAWELAEMLRDSPVGSIGSTAFVARFIARRRLDRMGGIRFTDSLVSLFSNPSGPLGAIRGLGLAALDIFPPARHFVARRMIFGSRSMP